MNTYGEKPGNLKLVRKCRAASLESAMWMGETCLHRTLIFGDNESPVVSDTAEESVLYKSFVPARSQRGQEGETESHSPHNVVVGLFRRLGLRSPSLDDLVHGVNPEVRSVHVDGVINAETTKKLANFNLKNVAHKRRGVRLRFSHAEKVFGRVLERGSLGKSLGGCSLMRLYEHLHLWRLDRPRLEDPQKVIGTCDIRRGSA